MKILSLILCATLSLFANEYYAKLEPVESYVIKAAVSGEVVYSNEEIEGKFANNSLIIQLDSEVDIINLEQTKNKLTAYDKMVEIERKNYERLKQVTTRSDFDKDTQLRQALNLEASRADLIISMAQLKKSIENKKLVEKNRYIYNISVKEGDYVTAGTLLYEAKDMSKGKLEIFIPIAEMPLIKDKSIYLDGEQTDLKIHKAYEVADSKHISSYKVEIIVPDAKQFSRLVKVEFK